MEMFLPAIMSDLLGRSVSFVVQRYRQQSSVEDSIQQLHLALLRVSVTVEEAEGRHITNRAMLRQLDVLREAMYGGYYMLDALTYGHSHHGADAPPRPCRFSSALSRLNSAKRLCFPAGGHNGGVAELGRMVDRLGSMIADMKEFVVFLGGYPRVCRQPHSAHLLLEKLMFGRQREMEQIVSFLLRAESNGVGVLPVVGPARVGKSTLVEHVCHDERVRNHFSSILLMSGDDLEVDEKLNDPGGHGLIKHRGHDASPAKSSLVILELAEDEVPDEGRWRRLCSSAFCNKGTGSKIIVTSRSEAAERLGTEHALRLKCLNQEAYWYYFKTLAFGSTNPEDHPKLVSIAMDICAEEKGSFIGANIACSLLRANLDTRFWCSILQNMREYTEKHRHLFGKHPHDLLRQKNRHVYLWRLAQTSKVFVSYGCYQACPAAAQKEVLPRMITLQEVLSGRPAPSGRFEALAWRSQIPPCYSYLMSCSVQTPPVPHVLARKNRSRLA